MTCWRRCYDERTLRMFGSTCRFVAASERRRAMEEVIMKDVPGWEARKDDAYSTGRWKPPYFDPARILLKA